MTGALATLLTERTVEFEILPFSFYEMMLYYELNWREFSEYFYQEENYYISQKIRLTQCARMIILILIRNM